MSELQTLTAEILEMERGYNYHAEQELYKKPFSIAPKPTPKPKRLGARQYAEVKQAEQKETMKKFKPTLFRSNFPTHR